jgi:hypothetical protein
MKSALRTDELHGFAVYEIPPRWLGGMKKCFSLAGKALFENQNLVTFFSAC